jgi:hypothetical protein
MFDAKAVVCVEYQDLDDADESEIFQVGFRVLSLPSFLPFFDGGVGFCFVGFYVGGWGMVRVT